MSIDQVMTALRALDYPATKEQIVEQAEREQAPDEVLKAVRALPLATYDSRDEIVRSVGTPAAPSQSESDAALKARNRSHPGLAQHERTPNDDPL